MRSGWTDLVAKRMVCRLHPEDVVVEAVYRSSCTANPVTQKSLEYAEEIVADLMTEVKSGKSEKEVFSNMMEKLRLDCKFYA